jgi:hypothetical protein
MSQSQKSVSRVIPQLASALLLCGKTLSSQDRNIKQLLDFFAIPSKTVTLVEIAGNGGLSGDVDSGNFCIFASAALVAEGIEGFDDSGGSLPGWMMQAGSIYIYGFQANAACKQLLRFLTRDPRSDIRDLTTLRTSMSVTNDFPEMCGPLSGMSFALEPSEGDMLFDVPSKGQATGSIIAANDGEVFLATTCRGVRFYLNACCKIVDIGAPAPDYFDVRTFFCSAVPITMYLKWAFRDICWNSAETNACLIIDDPLLQPRYGFLQFRETMELMDKQKFAMTVAFIPWNWRRTNDSTVNIFRQSPERVSLCIHGCDHTAGELASRSTALLNRRIKAASQRMELLRHRTSLHHDPVMVFPQGKFSPEIGRALKLNGFVAAVNTEVAPANDARNDTKIADLWDVAIMKYGTFPIFTRRYLTHGLVNFAFDALIGKPCLIAGHHDLFKDHGRELLDFVTKLNSLKCNLRWRPLGDAIDHSFKVRKQLDGTGMIQMYAEKLVIENSSTESREVIFMKEENEFDCVKAVMTNQTVVDCSYDGQYLKFRVEVLPKETAEVRVIYVDNLGVDASRDGLAYNIKTRARRYLSEFRDNYLSRSDFVLESAIRVKRLLKWTV